LYALHIKLHSYHTEEHEPTAAHKATWPTHYTAASYFLMESEAHKSNMDDG